MGFLDKMKEKAGQVKDATVKGFNDASASIKAHNEESKELKKTLDGALARYEFTYISGFDGVKKKSGAWGMNVMPDSFAFRVTMTTKDWLFDYDIPYTSISDIRIEKRSISTAEVFLGGSDNANQQQENVIVIEYVDAEGRKQTLRIEMLTGVTIYNQAAKCTELMDLLRKNDILDLIKKNTDSGDKGGNGGNDVLAQIEKLADLKEKGILSEEEFAAKKAELIAKL